MHYPSVRCWLVKLGLLATAAAHAVATADCQEPIRAPKLPPLPSEGPLLKESLLLKDFRPRSIFKVPETRVAKPRFPIIDVHSHPWELTQDGLGQWARTMDDMGVEQAVIMVAAAGTRFDDIAKVFEPHRQRFTLWCGIDLTEPDDPGYSERAVAELERCHALGATGVGELVDKGAGLFSFEKTTRPSGVHFDDLRLGPLFAKCAELNMPVNIHVAEPIWMYEPMDATNEMLTNASDWRLHGRPDIISHAELIATLDRTVGRHPGTTFIACHYANSTYDLDVLANLLDKHPNLYTDTAARFCQIASTPRRSAAFFEKYQDRILFGSDFTPQPDRYRDCFRILETEDEHFYEESRRKVQWPLYGLGLSDQILKKVYRDNALKILSPAGRP